MEFHRSWLRNIMVGLQNKMSDWNSRRIEEDFASRLEQERIRAILLNVPGSLPEITRRPGPFGPYGPVLERLPD